MVQNKAKKVEVKPVAKKTVAKKKK